MICRVACKPSTLGIWISMVMTSGLSDAAAMTARWPSTASPTTCISGCALIRADRNSAMVGESSTIRTRIIGRSYQATHGVEQRALIKAALDDVGIGAGFDAAL